MRNEARMFPFGFLSKPWFHLSCSMEDAFGCGAFSQVRLLCFSMEWSTSDPSKDRHTDCRNEARELFRFLKGLRNIKFLVCIVVTLTWWALLNVFTSWPIHDKNLSQVFSHAFVLLCIASFFTFSTLICRWSVWWLLYFADPAVHSNCFP